MNNKDMAMLLKANHSVRLMKDGNRRFVLPDGPSFPQFGRVVVPLQETLLTSVPGRGAAPVSGAVINRVSGSADILDDPSQLASENRRRALLAWGELLKAKWQDTTTRIFHGAQAL